MFRATGITAYFDSGGTLENAQARLGTKARVQPNPITERAMRSRLMEWARFQFRFSPTAIAGYVTGSPVQGFLLASAVFLTLVNPGIGFGQSCEQLPIDGLPHSYKFRANTPRCEGIYLSPVAGYPGMNLVSLTIGRVTYDPKRDLYLEIRLPAQQTEKMFVRAVGIPERLFYRLDVELRPGQSMFQLPLRDVVAPEHIKPEALGLYGMKMMANGQTAFVPVYAHGPSQTEQAAVFAVVRPGADVSNVEWRQYAPSRLATAWTPVTGATGLVPEGKPLEIVLGEIPGQITLEVSFRFRGVARADQFRLMSH
jgi:hypothetical protein